MCHFRPQVGHVLEGTGDVNPMGTPPPAHGLFKAPGDRTRRVRDRRFYSTGRHSPEWPPPRCGQARNGSSPSRKGKETRTHPGKAIRMGGGQAGEKTGRPRFSPAGRRKGSSRRGECKIALRRPKKIMEEYVQDKKTGPTN